MRGAAPGPALSRVLFASAFFIATCGLIYELVAGALASYLLGDSVTQFSLVIGVYLSSMGVGSYLSRYVGGRLVARFVEIEVAVALLGGFSAPVLFAAFAFTPAFRLALFLVVALVGTGVGLELPLLMRILESETSLRELVARVLFLDYIGALVASLAFPILLVPHLGLLRTSLVFGLVNAGVALWTTRLFEAPAPVRRRLQFLSGAAILALGLGFGVADRVEVALERDLFADPVVYREVTPYQRIVITQAGRDTRLFLDGALQFSSVDEYRYHEALVHPAMALAPQARRVLVLGGGDGLAVREVLRHPAVEELWLVDLDPAMTRLFTERPELAALNSGSLNDPRVHVLNRDAFRWLDETFSRPEGARPPPFDVAIVDFPDPNNYSLGKLYTTYFYRSLRVALSAQGVIAVQSTSPMFSPEAFWCVNRTLAASGFQTRPYHAYIPSFGEWGFVLASPSALGDFAPLPEGLRFLTDDILPTLFHFPPDMSRPSGPINRLDNQALVRLYEADWRSIQER